jgi:DNA-binding transcriptional ArsR family regulator
VGLTDDITDPRLAKALAHPLRLEILRHLGDRTASPSEIAAEIGAPLTNVSYHVRKLRSLGLIKLVRKTPKRGVVEHYYSAKPRRTVSDEAWAATPAIVKEALIAPMAENAVAEVLRAAASGGFDRKEAHFSDQPLKLDREGWLEVTATLKSTLASVLTSLEDATKRLESAPDGTEVVEAKSLMMLFETPKRPEVSRPESRRPAPVQRSRQRS